MEFGIWVAQFKFCSMDWLFQKIHTVRSGKFIIINLWTSCCKNTYGWVIYNIKLLLNFKKRCGKNIYLELGV